MTATRPFVRSAVLALSLCIVASGCGSGDGSAPANAQNEVDERPHNVRALEVRPTDLVETFYLSGRLEAERATDVSTEESGVVERLPIEKGALVRRGQVIVELDRDLLDAERNSAAAAQTLREYNEERTRSLFEANSVSKQEMLRVHTELEQSKEALRMATLRYERAAIKAPYDGVLVERFVELGQLVAPGERVARVVDPFTLQMETSVTEREVGYLEEGTPALISLEGVRDVIPARVSYVSLEADPMSGKFDVEIEVDNADLKLRAGIVARARVLKKVHAGVLAVPRDAVVRNVSGEAVFVVRDGRAQAVPVRLGPGQGLMVVIEAGLSEGDELVVRGQRQLQDGSRVAIQERATARDGSLPTDPAEVREEGNLEGLRDMGADGTRSLESPAPQSAEEGTGR